MTGRERLMTAMECGKADRLPCQVHNWMDRYLRVYLNGISPLEAYRFFDMDPVFYTGPGLVYSESDQARWEERWIDLGVNSDGAHEWRIEITTPEGTLVKKLAKNEYTQWQSEHPVKSKADFELFEKYQPVPVEADLTPMSRARDLVGDQGIVRIGAPGYGQGSPWQDLCELMGMEELIMAAMDEPEWVHHALKVILDHRVRIAGLLKGSAADVVETGGGAASSTVISPTMFREFCLPYDTVQNRALHDSGLRVVYHLCGGIMAMLEMVQETGADGIETMTPPGMGGDCRLAEAYQRIGTKMFIVGGFDQQAGFERGTPQTVRKQVFELFEACPEGGYICSPSDHFFDGDPANVRAFADACKECRY